MDNVNLSRQELIVPKELVQDKRVLVVGAGAIGSNLIHTLVSIGFRDITVYDNDILAEENFAPGFFSLEDIGKPKVVALYDDIKRRFNVEINRELQFFTERTRPRQMYDIVAIGPDSMESRRRCYANQDLSWELWIDGRMGGTICSVHTCKRDDQQARSIYEETLDLPNSRLACGEKAFAPLTKGMIQAFMGSAIYNYVHDEEVPNEYWFDMATGLVSIHSKSMYGQF